MQIGRLGKKAWRSLVESTARLNIWHGAVRSGKTVTSIVRWLEYVATAPPGDLAMIGKTERTLYRNVIAPMETMLGQDLCRYKRGTGELHLLGRRVWVLGANDAKAEGKVRGMTLAGAYGDELTLWPEAVFRQLLTRLSVPGAKFFGTTNPDNPRHWLKADFLDRAGELNLRAWHFTLLDNPHLTREYIKGLEAENTGLWRRRFVYGEWVAAEGAVYDMFSVERHVVDKLPRITRWPVVAVDYGTTNPFVALQVGVGADQRLYVAREWRWDSAKKGRQLTDPEYSRALLDWYGKQRPEMVHYDPSAASFGLQLWRDGHPAPRAANNDVLEGIRYVAALLAADRLRIHRSCAGLIEELLNYTWDPKAQERGEDRPLKQNDHGPDALRYAVMATRPIWRQWLRHQVNAEGGAA